MVKQTRIIQIFVIFILFVQIGFTQDKVMVKHKSNGSIFTTEVSNIDTLTFTENFVKDIDGNVYKTVIIGNQEWMAENLRVTHYNDGTPVDTPIPLVVDNTSWSGLSSGAYCFYDNSIYNVINYGCLYNWHAVKDNRNIAPDGWHVPSDEEWAVLETYIAANGHSGSEGTALKSTSGWLSNGNGTDNFGFNALPAGSRSTSGNYGNVGSRAYFWSATEDDSRYRAWNRRLYYSNPLFGRLDNHKGHGFSVRCLRD